MGEEVIQLGSELKTIQKRIKILKRKKGRVRNEYFSHVRNRLDGLVILFGEDTVREMGEPNYEGMLYGCRNLYFDDIKYRSKLRKIRDNIYYLENQHGKKFLELIDLKRAA